MSGSQKMSGRLARVRTRMAARFLPRFRVIYPGDPMPEAEPGLTVIMVHYESPPLPEWGCPPFGHAGTRGGDVQVAQTGQDESAPQATQTAPNESDFRPPWEPERRPKRDPFRDADDSYGTELWALRHGAE